MVWGAQVTSRPPAIEGVTKAPKLTLPEKPFNAVTVTVVIGLSPTVKVILVGLAEREKSAAATVTENEMWWESEPSTPAISTV